MSNESLGINMDWLVMVGFGLIKSSFTVNDELGLLTG